MYSNQKLNDMKNKKDFFIVRLIKNTKVLNAERLDIDMVDNYFIINCDDKYENEAGGTTYIMNVSDPRFFNMKIYMKDSKTKQSV